MTFIDHAICSIVPSMPADQFDDLKKDIAENGLREPIWLFEGCIIDGRHRYRACRELGIEPAVRNWDGGGSLATFVFSLNVSRRHLTQSQRAAMAVEFLELIEAEENHQANDNGRSVANMPPGLWRCPNCGDAQDSDVEACATCHEPNDGGPRKSRDRAAAATQVSSRYVGEAKRLKRDAPEVFKAVHDGKVKIPTAREIAELPANRRAKVLDEVKAGKSTKNTVRGTKPELVDKCAKLTERIQHLIEDIDRLAKNQGGHNNHSRDVTRTLHDCIAKVNAMERFWLTAAIGARAPGPKPAPNGRKIFRRPPPARTS